MEPGFGRVCALVCAAVACLQLAACGDSGMSPGGASGAATAPPAAAPPAFTAHPKYFIGSVVYMPPGETGSALTYGFGSVTGTTVSTAQSWNGNPSTGASAGTQEVVFGNLFGGSTPTSVDVQDNASMEANYLGPASNSVNHDYDQIWIFLGADVNAFADGMGNLSWGLDFSKQLGRGVAQSGYPVTAGCLKAVSSVPPADCAYLLNFLASAGITPADYPNILGADPFAATGAPASPDPVRYVRITAFEYLPSLLPPPTYTFSNSSALVNASTSSYTYTVASSVSGAYDGVSLKSTDTFSFTNSSTPSNRTGSTAGSISFTPSLPSAPYTGPATLFVYLDTIYKTLLFSFQ